MMQGNTVSSRSRIQAKLDKQGVTPYYSTGSGDAYLGDSLQLLTALPPASVSLVVTSPPFALRRKKKYGNIDAEHYIQWFIPFAQQVKRVLKKHGSFVIEIGGAWMPGEPTRSIYQYELLIALVRTVGFHLAQEFFWYNPAKMPGPAQWVTIDRVRCTDAVNTIWWLSKTPSPNANNRRVLKPYSDSMKRLLVEGYNEGARPSGHVASGKWGKNLGGAIPKNLLAISNTSAYDAYQQACRSAGIPMHPARFPMDLPRFFVKFLTSGRSDIVLDIFGGSNVTGAVAESLNRSWITFEIQKSYLESSKYRFGIPVDIDLAKAKV